MASRVQRYGVNSSQMASLVGRDREVVVDTGKKALVLHDGEKPGGYPMARADFSNTVAATQTNNGHMPATAFVQLEQNTADALVIAQGLAAEITARENADFDLDTRIDALEGEASTFQQIRNVQLLNDTARVLIAQNDICIFKTLAFTKSFDGPLGIHVSVSLGFNNPSGNRINTEIVRYILDGDVPNQIRRAANRFRVREEETTGILGRQEQRLLDVTQFIYFPSVTAGAHSLELAMITKSGSEFETIYNPNNTDFTDIGDTSSHYKLEEYG